MLISLEWLKEYVDISDINPKDLAEKLVLTGTNLEDMLDMGSLIDNIAVCEIVNIVPHPNADKLSICTAKLGEEEEKHIQVLTAAKNMKVGDYIPLAKVNSKLADGTIIKKSKMRGEESNGMFCSYQELGFKENVVPKNALEGLLILSEKFPYDMDIKEALNLKDTVIDFEITPNRADCLSVLGIAREAAVTLNKELKIPDVSIKNEKGNINDYIKVNVKSDLCERYIVKMVENVRIKPSPMWLQIRLMKAGVRPINNIVDITNYVLMELGQPSHAFDLSKLEGNELNIEMASNNEEFITLDLENRKLDDSILMIKDKVKSVAIAGIMGGQYSGISDTTNRILLEVACFEKSNIRKSSKKLGLRSESSSRFEKGIDIENCKFAMDRICHLIELLDAGDIVGGSIDVYNKKYDKKIVKIRLQKIRDLIGEEISNDVIIDIIEKIGCKIINHDEILSVEVPSYRLDLEKEVDFVEEVARFYGYNNLTFDLPSNKNISKKTKEQKVYDEVLETLIKNGFYEFKTYSFTSPKMIEKLKFDEERKNEIIKILNPLGEEFSIMRNNIISNLLDVVSYNLKRQNNVIKGFEIGNIFIKNDENAKNVDDYAIEKKQLCIIISDINSDFYKLKFIIEKIFNVLKIKNYEIKTNTKASLYHSGRCANIEILGENIGILGEINPLIAENYDIKERIYALELDFDKLVEYSNFDVKHIPLPKYPKATRDIAIIVNDDVTHYDIKENIESLGIKILENIELFDIYRGENIGENKKSMAYSLSFRDKSDTLNEEQIKKAYDKIVNKLVNDLSAILR